MTDPLTLLRDHRPEVPPAGDGERVAARSVLEAAIATEHARSTPVRSTPVRSEPTQAPVRPARSGRRRALVGASAVLGLAAMAAGAVLLAPAATPPASAGWAPEPGRLTAAETDDVDAGCRAALDDPPADLGLVHVDRRGGTSLAFYEGSSGTYRSRCFSTQAGAGWRAEGTSSVWFVAPPEGGWLGVEHLLDVAVGSVDSGYTWAAGVVDADVARVEVATGTGGEPLEATLADGHFSAYWPAPEAPGDVTVRLYDQAGDQLLEYVYTEEAIAEAAAAEARRALEVEPVEPAPAG
jgi:hypothetical protein